MKNLYKQDFAGIEAKYIFLAKDSAEAVKISLEAMKNSIKSATNNSLEDLIRNNTAFSETLTTAKNELDNFRKDLLNGKITASSSLSEKMFEDTIGEIFSNEGEKDKLRKALGISMPTHDADDFLDLDEFAESQEFFVNNTQVIIKKITENLISLPDNPEKEKILNSLKRIIKEIMPLEQKLATSSLTEEQRIQIEKDIEQRIDIELNKSKLDMGKMLEKFAVLAKKNPNNNSDDIDNALARFARENGERPPSETNEAPSGTMMEVYTQNPEISKFLAEFYPVPKTKSFSDDVKKFNITDSAELPEFFLNAKFGNRKKSIKENLKNFNSEESFEKLKAKIIADEHNDAQAQNTMSAITDTVKDLWTDVKSFMPDSMKHFSFSEKDVLNAESAEELFLNKMNEVLGIKSNDSDNPYEENQEKLSIAALEGLTRPLSLPDDAEMIDWMQKDISTGYRGSEWAENYRKALMNGDTRKNFNNWLKKDSGISMPERITNKLWHNLGYWFAQIGSWLGLDFAKDWLKKREERRKEEKNSPTKKKINEALEAKKAEKTKITNKKEWESESILKGKFRDFHTKNADLIKMGDFDELLGETSPEEFKKWDSTESREILKWAILQNPHHKVSIENWKILINEDVRLRSKTDKKGKVSHYLVIKKENMDDKEIHGWSDEDIENSFQESAQEKIIQKLIGEYEIFDENVTPKNLFKHKAKLFKNPNQAEDGTLKEPFAGLFALDKKFYTEKLSYNDLETLINKSDRLSGGVEETDTMNSKYWTMKNNTVIKVEEKEEKETFEVDIKGEYNWNPFTGQAFDSMKALVERLKIK